MKTSAAVFFKSNILFQVSMCGCRVLCESNGSKTFYINSLSSSDLQADFYKDEQSNRTHDDLIQYG